MSWLRGFNFRATSAFVTDGANETYVLDDVGGDADIYPVTRNSVTFGWVSAGGTVEQRDRNAGNDPRLAGINYPATEANELTFRVDLPATGEYDVRVALGDPGNARTAMQALIRDNGVTLLTVSGSTAAANSFRDATSTELTHNNWVSSNTAARLTFGSTIAQVVIGDSADTSTLAHVSFEQVEAGGSLGSYDQVIFRRPWR